MSVSQPPPPNTDGPGGSGAPGKRSPEQSFRLFAIGAIVLVVAIVLVRLLTQGDATTSIALPPPVSTAPDAATQSVDPATQAPSPRPKPMQTALPPELQGILDEGLPVYCGAGTLPLVALTFDDGPGVLSHETIDVLRERGATATFFLVGKFMKDPTQIAIAQDEASTFEIGNHSQSHFGLAGASSSTLKSEIVKPQRLITKGAGVEPLFFRPPWGSRDDALHAYLQEQGMIEVMWSLDSTDSAVGTNTEDILKILDENLAAGDIVLLHENRGTTRNAVPQILDMLTEKGLTPVTVSELLIQDPPSRQQLKQGTC